MPRKPAIRPRKQPKQARARATVEALLEATARVLMRWGYDRASTNRIAEAAGVNVGSLYQYFPSKEALVAALIDQHLDDLSRALAASFETTREGDVPTVVRAVVRAHLAAHAARPALHRVLVEQIPRVERLNPVVELRRRVIALVRGWLEARRRELVVTDLDFAAFAVVHVVDTLTQASLLERPHEVADEALVERISAVVLRYLL